jgi:hypothetical protein
LEQELGELERYERQLELEPWELVAGTGGWNRSHENWQVEQPGAIGANCKMVGMGSGNWAVGTWQLELGSGN